MTNPDCTRCHGTGEIRVAESAHSIGYTLPCSECNPRVRTDREVPTMQEALESWAAASGDVATEDIGEPVDDETLERIWHLYVTPKGLHRRKMRCNWCSERLKSIAQECESDGAWFCSPNVRSCYFEHRVADHAEVPQL